MSPTETDETPDNPFDGEAAREAQRYLDEDPRLTANQARDFVAIRYLLAGNTGALAHFLMSDDYVLGPAVKKLLSFMLQPDRVDPHDQTIEVSEPVEQIPYALVVRHRAGKKGRRRDLAADERNSALAEEYRRRVDAAGPGSSESVILQMVEDYDGVTELMIREAIKQRSRKSPKAG